MFNGSLQGLWKALDSKRTPFLSRAREASALTLPFVVPPQDTGTGSLDLPTPHQSDGARGVNNLSAKLLLSQFPPNSPFFKLDVDDATLEAAQVADDSAPDEIRQTLNKATDAVHFLLETSGFRPVASETFRNLVIAGNCLLEWQEDKEPRLFSLERYVCERDGEGNVERVIIKESLSKLTLPQDIQRAIQADEGQEDVDLFTLYERMPDGSWKTRQEAANAIVSQGSFNAEDLPILVLRMNRKQGENYGRGIVEEYIGDLKSLEALRVALVIGASASSRVIGLVDPNGSTEVKALNDTPNGGFASGNAEDVQWLKVDKLGDFQFVLQTAATISESLGRAFLLNTSIQRHAERVTAEEIRFMAQELEDTFGGTYTMLTREFQLPLVRLLLRRLAKEGVVPELPRGLVEPKIVTGIEALGRGQELLRLRGFHADAVNLLGPEQAALYLNATGALSKLAVDYGLNTEGLIRSEEEVQQIQAQAQVQSFAESGTGRALAERVVGE